jgi:hypothetical protein
MATKLALALAVQLSGNFANIIDINQGGYNPALTPTFIFDDGTGALQANNIFTDTRTLAASANEDLDLNGATLINVYGTALALTKVRGLVITAAAANTNDVQVGGAASNGFISAFGAATDKIKVKPGGLLVLCAPDVNGYSVTAATADLLRITNGGAGTTVDYTIAVWGS